ncbi:MAG TPA: 2-dehydropantoate 2-reductase, partial [Burkholderiaceae bacterium]
MHIAIVGAGGIGGYFGARLIEAGEQVSFVARGAHAAAIREHGLRITSPLGNATVRPHAVAEDPAALGAADLVVFAVKLPDAERTASQLKPLLDDGTVVLPLQNGVDVADLLARHIGARAVAVGAALISARIGSPGVVEHLGQFARLRYGPLQPAQAERLQAFHAACLRARVDAELLADPRRAIWEKFVFLVGMSSLTALTRQPIGVIREHAEMRRLLRQVMSEVAALARAEGVALDEAFVDAQMAAADKLPPGIKASMLGDLLAGKPLELPWLAGAVVRRSETHGLKAEANRFVAAALAPYV